MKALINDLHHLCANGLRMRDWGRTDQLLSSHDCVFRRVSTENLLPEFWSSAIWFEEGYRGNKFESAYQIVWPDRAGKFPWEGGFDEKTGGGQLSLWEGGAIH